MRAAKLMFAMAAAVVVAGCSGVDQPSRNSGFDTSLGAEGAFGLTEPAFADVLPSYRVEGVSVTVPDALIVSEANVYYPRADIVWHGDEPGNRHEQVKTIIEDAFTQGAETIQGDVPVTVDVTLERFHSMTPKTRYTVGGVHAIRFTLAIRDAETSLLLEEPRTVQADLKGFGGQRAIDAERQGQTQKVRISEHLATVIQDELQDPDGFVGPRLGLLQGIGN